MSYFVIPCPSWNLPQIVSLFTTFLPVPGAPVLAGSQTQSAWQVPCSSAVDLLSALAYFLNERQAQDFADKLAEVSPVAQNGAASSMFALLAGYAGHCLEHGKKSPNAYLRLDPSKGANENVLELVVGKSNQHIGLLQMAHMRCGESSIPNHAFHNSHELYITLYSCIYI